MPKLAENFETMVGKEKMIYQDSTIDVPVVSLVKGKSATPLNVSNVSTAAIRIYFSAVDTTGENEELLKSLKKSIAKILNLPVSMVFAMVVVAGNTTYNTLILCRSTSEESLLHARLSMLSLHLVPKSQLAA